MNIEIYKEVERQYDIKRQNSEKKAKRNKQALMEEISKYQELEDKKNEIAITHAKTIISKNGVERQIAEENMQIKLNQIQKEIDNVLKNNGHNIAETRPTYECNKCNDTGRIYNEKGEEYCKCFVQKIVDKMYRQYNMLKIDEENFNTFDIGYYSDKVDKEKYKSDTSPRENILNIKKIAEKFCKNVTSDSQKNLLFVGNTGTGKTFISNCIAYDAIQRGYTVLYQTAPMLMDMLMDSKYSFDRKSEDKAIYRNIFDVDLLIIDDLGTETLNNTRFTELFNIINTRLLKSKKTIISTNLGLNELQNQYDERVISRLIGNYEIYKFIGDDIRLKKKKIME